MRISTSASTLAASLLTFLCAPLFAQVTDSLQVIIGATATFVTKDYQPLWLESLQSGTIKHQQTDLSTHLLVTNAHVFKRKAQNGIGTPSPAIFTLATV